jgi:hypothetical protein
MAESRLLPDRPAPVPLKIEQEIDVAVIIGSGGGQRPCDTGRRGVIIIVVAQIAGRSVSRSIDDPVPAVPQFDRNPPRTGNLNVIANIRRHN